MTRDPNNTRRAYYVLVTRRGDSATPFFWKIERRHAPMGVEISGGGFRSHQAAQQAGKEALDKLLSDMSDED